MNILTNEDCHSKNNASGPDRSPKQATNENILDFEKSTQSQPKLVSKVITGDKH